MEIRKNERIDDLGINDLKIIQNKEYSVAEEKLLSLISTATVKNIEDEKVFTELLNKGYQKINNKLWIQYLKNILIN